MGSCLGCERFLDEHTGKPTRLAGLWPVPIAFAPEGWGEALNRFFSHCPRMSQHLPGTCLWLPVGVVFNQPSYTMSAKAEWKSEGRGRNRLNQEFVHHKSQSTNMTSTPSAAPHQLREDLKVREILIITLRHYLPFYCVKPYLKHLLYVTAQENTSRSQASNELDRLLFLIWPMSTWKGEEMHTSPLFDQQ